MNDYIVRAAAAGHAVRAFAITAKDLTEQARSCHHTSPVVTAALGRLLAAGAMMGVMMKSADDLLTLQVISDGPVKDIELPLNELGKLDVGGAVGPGMLRVIKDLGLKEPYIGTTQLQTGEIAEDLTYYFASSEQVPSSVGLGVLVDTDCSVRRAGGFIIQLMPGVTDEVIGQLEENLKKIRPVTDMLEMGHTPEQILEELLDGLEMEITDRIPAHFACSCSKERIEKALVSIPKKDMKSIVDDQEPIEIKCQFCSKAYQFEVEELEKLLAQMQ